MRWSLRRSAHDLPVVALLYAVALLATNVWLESSSARIEAQVLRDVSTNLDHLAHEPLRVLAASAFFTTGGLPFAVAGAIVCVGLLERVAGWRMTIIVAVSAHVIGTLFSEGLIAIRIAANDAPASLRYALDVGPSYVIVGCAIAVVAWPSASRLARVIAAVAVAPLFVFTAWRLPAGRIDAVGHLTAATTGLVLSFWVSRRQARSARARRA